jgi:hypothetical protein
MHEPTLSVTLPYNTPLGKAVGDRKASKGGRSHATSRPPPLYDRLGGVYNIAVVVDDLIDRVMDDSRLNATLVWMKRTIESQRKDSNTM